MAGPSIERSATFTRPANTTQYAAGDIVANDGTAAQMSWGFNTTSGVWLREIRIHKTKVDATAASFRLWLHSDSAVTFSNNDNGALAIASTSLAVNDIAGAFELPSTEAKALTGAGTLLIATFDTGLVWLPNTAYGFLEARDTYTPASGEIFTIYLRGDPYP